MSGLAYKPVAPLRSFCFPAMFSFYSGAACNLKHHKAEQDRGLPFPSNHRAGNPGSPLLPLQVGTGQYGLLHVSPGLPPQRLRLEKFFRCRQVPQKIQYRFSSQDQRIALGLWSWAQWHLFVHSESHGQVEPGSFLHVHSQIAQV